MVGRGARAEAGTGSPMVWQGPDMSESPTAARSSGGRASTTRTSSGGRSILVSAGFTFANVAALFIALVWILVDYDMDDDIWWSLACTLWIQATVNGLVLLLFPRTRRLGVGVLLGTIGTAVALYAFLIMVVAPHLS